MEKALNLPWVEFILRMVKRMKRSETKMVRVQLKRLKPAKIKIRISHSEVLTQDRDRMGGPSQKKCVTT